MTIPSQIEQDVISGKAVYRTLQLGGGGQSILPVGQNQSVVIFGYVFSPAGNGFVWSEDLGVIAPGAFRPYAIPVEAKRFMSQQILFYTENDFFPFVENVKMISDLKHISGSNYYSTHAISADAISRSCYIPSNNNVSVAVMLLERAVINTAGTIPVTSTTPNRLSYGGSGVNTAVQMDLGTWPDQFLQPIVQGWDAPPYSYGLIPNNAQEQYWQAFDRGNAAGPYDPANSVVNAFQTGDFPIDGSFYKLTLHYALYNNPEK